MTPGKLYKLKIETWGQIKIERFMFIGYRRHMLYDVILLNRRREVVYAVFTTIVDTIELPESKPPQELSFKELIHGIL